MTVIPSEEEPPHFLREVLAEPDLAARVLQTGEWTKVDDDNVDDFVRELDSSGQNDIERFIIYEEHRVAANQHGATLLERRSDSEPEETQPFEHQGVEIFRVHMDAFDLVWDMMSDDDPEPAPAQFDPRSSAGEMDKIALLHGFLVQGHSFFFTDRVEFSDSQPPSLNPSPTSAVLPPNQPGGRKIGIIDTGADTDHSWLSSIRADSEQNGSWHGTVVAGIARQGDPQASIIVRRPELSTISILRELSIATALFDLIDAEKCEIVNCSFGAFTFGKVPLFRWAISWLRENVKQFEMVAAAGNRHGDHARVPIYPAAWKEVIAVAAGDGDQPADESSYYDWSNGGAWVDEIVKIGKRGTTDHWLRSSAPIDVPGIDRFAYVVGTSAVAPLITAKRVSKSNQNAYDMTRV